MGEHRRKQLIGVAGSLAGFATVALAWSHPGWFASVALPANDTAARLRFVAHWLLLPGLCLLFGIFGAASRGFYADAIDGTRTPASHRLEITLRYNINTVEQTVLAAIALAGIGDRVTARAVVAGPSDGAAVRTGTRDVLYRLSDYADRPRLRHGGDGGADANRIRVVGGADVLTVLRPSRRFDHTLGKEVLKWRRLVEYDSPKLITFIKSFDHIFKSIQDTIRLG